MGTVTVSQVTKMLLKSYNSWQKETKEICQYSEVGLQFGSTTYKFSDPKYIPIKVRLWGLVESKTSREVKAWDFILKTAYHRG
jgi:hypothetical protein